MRIAGLRATVLLQLTLLIKAKIRIQAFSALGIALLLLQTLIGLAAIAPLALDSPRRSRLWPQSAP